MALLDRFLYILRVAIDPTDDNEVFDSTCNVKLTMTPEAEIARSQKWSLSVSSKGFEGRFGLFGLFPVALSNTKALNPNLADMVRAEHAPRIGVDNDNTFVGCRFATANHTPSIGRVRCNRGHHSRIELSAVECSNDGWFRCWAARDNKSRFCHAVAREVASMFKSAWSEFLAKHFQRVCSNRFSSVKCQCP